MKSSLLLFFKVILLAVFFWASLFTGCFAQVNDTHQKVVFYVSTSGNDQWSGKLSKPNQAKSDGPFATLERARDAIRNLKQNKELNDSVIVYIKGGDYYLKKTFTLESIDSGTPNAPITYKAFPGDNVELIGGVKIAGFKRVTNTVILNQLPSVSRNNIKMTNLKQLGITNYGDLNARGFGMPQQLSPIELFYNNQRMPLARWPNEGWTKIKAIPSDHDPSSFIYTGNRPIKWINAPDAWLHGYWSKDWADSYVKISRIDTVQHQIITLKPYGVYGYSPGGRYYVLNVLDELDSPGEWYLDRKTGNLFFFPPDSTVNPKPLLSMLNTIISMHNTSNITIEGLKLEVCRGNGIEIIAGRNVILPKNRTIG